MLLVKRIFLVLDTEAIHETSQQTETNIAPEEVAQDTVIAVESETSTPEPQPVEAVVAMKKLLTTQRSCYKLLQPLSLGYR